MARSRLLNKFHKEKTEENKDAYKKKKKKKILCEFYILKIIKTFWKVVKPYFSTKSTRNEKITLAEEKNNHHR